MRISKKWRSGCFRLSTLLLAAGLQCYAYAGFAVNSENAEPAAIYESATTLVPKSVTKEQALAYYAKNKDRVKVVFAYELTRGEEAPTLAEASEFDAFCINPYTLKVGVALKAKDAMALTQARPQVFYAVAGESLSATVTRWAKEQGYSAKWSSPNDFKIQYSHIFYGSFQNTLNDLLGSIAASSDGFAVKAVIMKNGVVVFKPNEYQARPVTGF
ncbi:MAG: TcpQ domain-containing protein [Pseudomonadota bacterium]